MRLAVFTVLLTAFLPASALGQQGILLLVDEGTAEWNAQVRQLAATLDSQKPAEVAFWAGAKRDAQAAVDRLVRRGASEVVAVPLFIAASTSDLASKVKSAVPLRMTPHLNGDPVVSDVILRRAEEISSNAAAEVLLIVSHRSTEGDDQRWVPDLAAAARQLNLLRRFGGVVSWQLPTDPLKQSESERASFRRVVEREVSKGLRLVVVPVATPYGGLESAIKRELQGVGHQVARPALVPDVRLVDWILSQAERK